MTSRMRANSRSAWRETGGGSGVAGIKGSERATRGDRRAESARRDPINPRLWILTICTVIGMDPLHRSHKSECDEVCTRRARSGGWKRCRARPLRAAIDGARQTCRSRTMTCSRVHFFRAAYKLTVIEVRKAADRDCKEVSSPSSILPVYPSRPRPQSVSGRPAGSGALAEDTRPRLGCDQS
jgi:hypothetical protein